MILRIGWRTFRLLQRVLLVLIIGGLVVWAGLWAHAATRVSDERYMGNEALAPVPGSALRITLPMSQPYMPADQAAPARGVTGTTSLPALPPESKALAAIAATGTSVVAAQPFALTGIGTVDRGRAVQCLTAAIYYEAASESDAGQRAVAQVVLNRVRHPAFPASVCGVVYQGSERAGCQFSFACDGAMARKPANVAWARAARIAGAALSGYVYAPVGLATHYHTYAVTPSWNRSLVMTDVVGAHFFHRWKGYWGTAAAFSQRYRGDEPVPEPHLRNVVFNAIEPTPSLPDVPVTMSGPTSAAGGGSTMTERPVHSEPNNLPPESQILDKWKDTGKPIVP